ncbi:MAG: YhjD/YihY/BrkB family envelope integrity protein [Planctomycetota bacterium]
MQRRHPSFVDRISRRGPLQRMRRFFLRDLWMQDVARQSWVRARITRTLRILAITARGVMRDEVKKHAQALTYITVFSMIPLLAFAFAIAKGFGAYRPDQAQAVTRMLDDLFGARVESYEPTIEPRDGATEPAIDAERGREGDAAPGTVPPDPEALDRPSAGDGVTDGAPTRGSPPTAISLREGIELVRQQAEKADLKALGALGLFFLLYAMIRMLGALEASLNDIWGIQRQRSFVRKVTDYTAIMVVTPVIVIGGTVWLQREEFIGDSFLLALVPLFATSLGMAFALYTFPNGHVNPDSALVGGLLAGVGWQAILFLIVQGQIGLARLEGLYATFAAIPMLLLFFYFSWWILLVGGEVAYAHQNEPVFTSIARTGAIDQAWRESLAPRLAGRIAHAFLAGEPPPTATSLASELGVPPRHVGAILDELVVRGLLARVTDEDDEEAFLPARDPVTITLLDLLEALRHDGEINVMPTPTRLDLTVDRLLARLRAESRASASNVDLVQLAASLEEERNTSGDA